MALLSNKLGVMEYDGLITDVAPPAIVGSGEIKGATDAVTYKRGTILAKSAKTGLLSILGTEAASGDTLTADCILTDDVEVPASTNTTVTVYLSGRFNEDKLTVKDKYTMTEADKAALRVRSIFFKASSEM